MFAVFLAIFLVFIIKLTGAGAEPCSENTTGIDKIIDPVILFTILCSRSCHNRRHGKLKSKLISFSGSFNDPGHDCRTGILYEKICIVFDVCGFRNFRIERDNNQTPPDPVINRFDIWEMVCIQDRCMGRNKAERLFEFYFAQNRIRRTNFFDHRRAERLIFLQFGSNHQTFSFQFSNFSTEVHLTVAHQ